MSSLHLPDLSEVAQWPNRNLIDPETRGPLVLIVEIPLLAVTCFIVGLRFYSRACIKKVLGWDDWVMLAATVIAVTITSIHCVATKFAQGLHIWDVPPHVIVPTAKMSYSTMVLFAPAASLTKISICMTQLRTLPTTGDRRFAKIAILFITSYCISITFVMIFQCIPIERYWSPIKRGVCVKERPFNISAQALNSFSDFLIFLWPSRTLWSVRLPRRQRYGLIFVFSFGVIVCVAGIARIWYISRFFMDYDVFWTGAILFVLHGIEMNVGIICGCLPGIKPLLARAYPTVFGTGVTGDMIFHPSCRLPGQRLSIHTDPTTSRSGYSPPACHRPMAIPHAPVPAHLSPDSLSVVTVPIKYEGDWDSPGYNTPMLWDSRGRVSLVGLGVSQGWDSDIERTKSPGDV